jgi:hypothetical protein
MEPEKHLMLANGSETTFISRQWLQTNRFLQQQPMRNSGDTVGNMVFYGGLYRGVIRKRQSEDLGSWKEAAIQRGLKHRSRGIASVRSGYLAITSEDATNWEYLVCVVAICRVCKLAMVLQLSVIRSHMLKWSINSIPNPKHHHQPIINVTILSVNRGNTQ